MLEKLNVVDLTVGCPGDPRPLKLPSHTSRSIKQLRDVLRADRAGCVLREEKPVATPGDVAGDRSEPFNLYRDLFSMAKAQHVLNRHAMR